MNEVTSTSSKIDSDGNIIDVSQSKTTTITSSTIDGVKSISYIDANKKINLSSAPNELQIASNTFSEYKKSNNGISPIQALSKENSKNSNLCGIISTITGVTGLALSFIPHPATQGGARILTITSRAIGGVSATSGVVSYGFETNPEKIRK